MRNLKSLYPGHVLYNPSHLCLSLTTPSHHWLECTSLNSESVASRT